MTNTDIPWFAPVMTGAELGRLADVLDRNFLNDGPLTREFERQVANRAGVPYAVAVTSGTAAIALALMAKGVGPGDEVIVPDLTFVATANAVRLAGATVVLADVELDRFALSPQSVADASRSGPARWSRSMSTAAAPTIAGWSRFAASTVWR